MKRAAIATSVSLAAHALALVSLSRSAVRSSRDGAVTVAVVDTRDGGGDGTAGPSSGAAEPAPLLHEPADRRPIPRARRSRVARVDPSPVPDAEPLPIAPDGQTGATDDARLGDSTAPSPSDSSGASATSGVGATPGPGAPGPPAPASSSARSEGRPPGLDRESCIDHVDYPWRARLFDKEGMVRLRVVLGADGRVESATVVQRAGYGFDETAVKAVMTRCRFTPAYDADGRPVPYVIDNYHFYFRLDDFDAQTRLRNWQRRW